MKLGILGDLHLHSKAPERRLDVDYLRTCEIKLYEALKLLDDCDVLIQVGDFFDSYNVSNKVKTMAIEMILRHRKMIYCVYGQHDLSGHSASTFHNSPLRVLQAAGAVHVLGNCPVSTATNESKGKDFITMYGASFGEEVPEVNTEGFTILVTHRMIGDRPLYPGHELVGPRAFLRDYPDFDLVCCGDYHYRFDDGIQGRTILNPGVMMRKSLKESQMGHEPAVYVVDTQTRRFEIRSIPCEPIEDVMDLEKKETRKSLDLEGFIRKLNLSEASQIGWKNILLRVMKKRATTTSVRDVITESMIKLEECND